MSPKKHYGLPDYVYTRGPGRYYVSVQIAGQSTRLLDTNDYALAATVAAKIKSVMDARAEKVARADAAALKQVEQVKNWIVVTKSDRKQVNP